MADTDTAPLNPHGSADKPLILDEKGRPLDPAPDDHHLGPSDPAPAAAGRPLHEIALEQDEFAIPAAARIRAFEEEAFKGSQIQVVRIGDRLERGAGSAFAALSPELRRQHAALEKLVAAEQKLADAHAALIQADVEHDAALAAAEPAPDAE